jgi:hypothetical protein
MTFEVPIEGGERPGTKIIATFFRAVKLLEILDLPMVRGCFGGFPLAS